jgi:hypothetical protein
VKPKPIQRPVQEKRRNVDWRWYALALQLAFTNFSAFADDSENNQDLAEILQTGTKAVPIKVVATSIEDYFNDAANA